MSDDPESASPPNHYAAVLADLKARRDQIDAAIAGLEALMGGITPTADRSSSATAEKQSKPEVIAPGFFYGLSIPEAAKKLLAHKRVNLSNLEIAESFAAGGLALQSKSIGNTINSVLSRRFKDVGDIVKVKRGVWGLREWHPHIRPRPNGMPVVDVDDAGEEE